MGNSSEDAPRDRAGSDHSEKCDEQRCGAGVSGICEEQGGPGDSGKVRFCFYWLRPCECFPLANMDALFLSFRLALCVSAILLVIGMPVAYWLAFSSWRGKFLLESIVALPLVLPPTVLGFYALVAMGPRGPLGKLWIALFGHGLAFTFAGLVLASVLYSFPFAVQPLIASFEGVDRKLLDASAVLGAGRLRTFRRVILPLALPGVVTALVLSFAHTLGEFGVVLMVGGNLTGVTRTVSVDIYDHVQSLEYGQANHMALVLLLISVAGKSTLLDCLAGLAQPDAGRIAVGGDLLFDSSDAIDIPARKRRIAYVFQALALFPHLSVEENVGYGLSDLREENRRGRVEEILATFRVENLGKQKPGEISGGERQRIALAR